MSGALLALSKTKRSPHREKGHDHPFFLATVCEAGSNALRNPLSLFPMCENDVCFIKSIHPRALFMHTYPYQRHDTVWEQVAIEVSGYSFDSSTVSIKLIIMCFFSFGKIFFNKSSLISY
jgi:hypothetical protein